MNDFTNCCSDTVTAFSCLDHSIGHSALSAPCFKRVTWTSY